ncbi:phospholipase A [Eleftheria terrae]|uniref:phospholipase A n=1 Tax=Eleftheria terrae TaxID=1597781 RepID=UPI00263B9A68|nr:phospholipase A [Eleftheria terrae]WKB51542.1 phospholipase A [Eleftheria terrae]
MQAHAKDHGPQGGDLFSHERAARRLLLGGWALTAAAAAWAQAPVQPLSLTSCAEVPGDSERLACYDRLAGRGQAPAAAPAGATTGEPAARASLPAPLPAATPEAPAAATTGAGPGLRAGDTPSLWSSFWELDSSDKRGTFRFKTYRPNFLLPVHYTSDINRRPSSPTRPSNGSGPDYKRLEAKLQLSVRTKIAQGLLLPGADLWFGYTQQSLWQVWNRKESSPFRNTDFEPELIYVVPVPEGLRRLPGGWQFRMLQAGLAHQSNGQPDPLSRSWNRIYVGAGLERGDVTLYARLNKRLSEDPEDNDNPDLTKYVGRSEVAVTWIPGSATASLRWRQNLKDFKRGSLQLDWTYPVDSAQPDGLRWYLQAFTGYGETLLDYNYRQTSFGAGLTLFEF